MGGYHPIAIGDIFQNRYYTLRKLGWGHFSTVWLCYDVNCERYCAIKVVKSAEHFTETGRDEIRLSRTISNHNWHPLRQRLIELIDFFYISGPNGTHLCLVFEALGDNLLSLIQRSRYQGLPLWNVKQIAKQVLEGLCFLHTQCSIIHTDLKPENVLLMVDDYTFRTQANDAAETYLKDHAHLYNGTGNGNIGNAYCSKSNSKSNRSRQHNTGIAATMMRPSCPHNEEGEEGGDHRCSDSKLTKTAKKRLRSKIKRSINFFQSHRLMLRQRGIDELLQLATMGLLTPIMAASCVRGNLSFLPFTFDNLIILDDKDMEQLKKLTMIERVGDMPSKDAIEENPSSSSRTTLLKKHLLKCEKSRKNEIFKHLESSSKMLKLLMTSPEKFMRYVKKRIQEKTPSTVHKKVHAAAYPKLKHPPRNGQTTTSTVTKSQSFSLSGRSKKELPEPNINLISRKDPATEPCKLSVKIADIGNACWFHHHFTDDIQTREYRAVEVILGAGYDETADVWSAACLFWELATGDYLFDPQITRDGDVSQDEAHIANIIETCGCIPEELIGYGDYAGEIFEGGELRNVKDLRPRSLTNVLIDRYRWPDQDAQEFVAFLMPMLQTDPRLRVSAADAMHHKWLKLEKDDRDEVADRMESKLSFSQE
ncbi:SRSF protein kinase 3-like [Drosophila tropicalis]|uniref:SRSF protein kinase 3-like n=1 Tax=Drosophila tropicalis TaxID=46794 RepID=UPI0035ABDED3